MGLWLNTAECSWDCNRMEKAAATEEQGHALALLRDTAMETHFIQGVQELSVCQELGRIVLHSAGNSFHHMPNETLYLLDKEQYGVSRRRDSSPANCILLQMVQTQQYLQTQMMQLVLVLLNQLKSSHVEP